MRYKLLLITFVAGTLLATSFSADAQRKQYRWVDEDGVVHYGDRIPPEYAQQAVDEMSERGITVGTRDAPMTEEEHAEAQLRRATDEAARQAAEAQAHRDRMLLATYLSVDDVEEARDRRIDALEAQIRLSKGSKDNLERILAEYREEAARHESSGREIPEDLAARIHSTSNQLDATVAFIETREKEIEDLEAQFAADIERLAELRGVGTRR